MPSSSRIASVVSIALILGACVFKPTESSSAIPPGPTPTSSLANAKPTPLAVPTATPRPTLPPVVEPSPPANLELVTSIEQDGLRVSLTLERNPMPAGEPTWATSRVENLGSTVVSWSHDGCATTTSAWGEMGAEWKPAEPGDERVRQFHEQLAIYVAGIWITFTPEKFIGMGTYACADIGITEEIKPGAAIEQRMQWNGQVSPRFGPPPSGLAHFTVSSGHFSRGDRSIASTPEGSLESTIDVWVSNGRNPAWLEPLEVVDRMLASPDMRAYFDEIDPGLRRLFDARAPWLRFNDGTQLWEAGLIQYTPEGGHLHFALVHPWTGDVLSIVDRAWVPEVDGSP